MLYEHHQAAAAQANPAKISRCKHPCLLMVSGRGLEITLVVEQQGHFVLLFCVVWQLVCGILMARSHNEALGEVVNEQCKYYIGKAGLSIFPATITVATGQEDVAKTPWCNSLLHS